MWSLARLPQDSEHLRYWMDNFKNMSTGRAAIDWGYEEDWLSMLKNDYEKSKSFT